MAEAAKTVCITCSLAVGEPPQLNRLKNGQTCPACRDRVLNQLPPLLPHRTSQGTPHVVQRSDGEASLFDTAGDAGYAGEPPSDRGFSSPL